VLASHANLLFEWVRRDFRVRYAQTSLGAFWALAQPITLTLTFVFLFRRVANIQTPVPYASFVLPGMLAWTLFASGLNNGVNAMSGSMYIASKANYPRVVAPLSGAVLPAVDLLSGVLLLPILFLVQDAPGRFLPIPFVFSLLGCLLLSSGLGCFASALAIFLRDLRNVLPLALQLLLLLTPVAYPASRLPTALRWNPMATFVTGFRSALLDIPGPSLLEWTRSLGIGVLVLALGLWYFHRVEARFADVA
jgi:ABC-type polysaccharide/polyol phosphate export permease